MTENRGHTNKPEIVFDRDRAFVTKSGAGHTEIYMFLFLGVCFLGISIFLINTIIKNWYNDLSTHSGSGFLCVMALIVLSIVCLAASYEAYLDFKLIVGFTQYGLMVKYPFHKTRLLKWEEFQNVCLCNPFAPTRYYSYLWEYEVMCFVMKGEQKNRSGRWKTENPFHLKRLICISHTEELLNAAQRWCPLPIEDE